MPRILMEAAPRSERIAVLTTLRTKVELAKIAAIRRTSVNDVINNAITQYLDKNRTDIQRYNDFFGEE